MDNNTSNKIEVTHEESSSDVNGWAVSYGDVVTLLLVFFIIVASAAEMSSVRLAMLHKAFKGETEEMHSIEKLQQDLKAILEKNNMADDVRIEPAEDGVHVIIKNKLLYSSGSANISTENIKKITPILQVFHGLPKSYHFSIEGHTDNVPIKSELFASNWHLSTARALSILELFKLNNFSDRRLRVQGFADQKPIAPNEDEQKKPIEVNQKQNRRAVIRIF